MVYLLEILLNKIFDFEFQFFFASRKPFSGEILDEFEIQIGILLWRAHYSVHRKGFFVFAGSNGSQAELFRSMILGFFESLYKWFPGVLRNQLKQITLAKALLLGILFEGSLKTSRDMCDPHHGWYSTKTFEPGESGIHWRHSP